MLKGIIALKSWITQPVPTRLAKRMGLKAKDRNSRKGHIDLHLHSWYSDGIFSPTQLVQVASFIGLTTIALADHDTNAGLKEFEAACNKFGVKSIPAVELTTDFIKVHILGYNMSFRDPELLSRMNEIQEVKGKNIQKILENFRKEGKSITEEDIKRIFPQGAISRVHLIKPLMRKGIVARFYEGFVLIEELSQQYKNLLPYPYFTIEEAIGLIHADGGIPIWAHPGDTHNPEKIFNEFIKKGLWGKNGLRGLEFVHGRASDKTICSFIPMIDRLRDELRINPILTVGSDFHDGQREIFGGVNFPPEVGKADDVLLQLNAARRTS